MDVDTEAEGFTRLTYEIDESAAGVSKLTLVHELEKASRSRCSLPARWRAREPAAAGPRCSAT